MPPKLAEQAVSSYSMVASSRLVVPHSPAMLPSLAVVVKLRILPNERETQHAVGLRFIGPDGDLIVPPIESPISLIIAGQPDDRPLYHVFVINMHGVPMKEPGLHKIVVMGDGVDKTTLSLYADPVPSLDATDGSESEDVGV